MARRSTRNKILNQVDSIQREVEKITVHLQSIDEFAEEKSKVINQWLPQLVKMMSAVQNTFKVFKGDL